MGRSPVCVGLEPERGTASLRTLGSQDLFSHQTSPEREQGKAGRCALARGRQAGLRVPHVSGLINWVPTISSPASFFLVEEFIGITTRVELAVRVTLE